MWNMYAHMQTVTRERSITRGLCLNYELIQLLHWRSDRFDVFFFKSTEFSNENRFRPSIKLLKWRNKSLKLFEYKRKNYWNAVISTENFCCRILFFSFFEVTKISFEYFECSICQMNPLRIRMKKQNEKFKTKIRIGRWRELQLQSASAKAENGRWRCAHGAIASIGHRATAARRWRCHIAAASVCSSQDMCESEHFEW